MTTQEWQMHQECLKDAKKINPYQLEDYWNFKLWCRRLHFAVAGQIPDSMLVETQLDKLISSFTTFEQGCFIYKIAKEGGHYSRERCVLKRLKNVAETKQQKEQLKQLAPADFDLTDLVQNGNFVFIMALTLWSIIALLVILALTN